jgi:zinc protease
MNLLHRTGAGLLALVVAGSTFGTPTLPAQQAAQRPAAQSGSARLVTSVEGISEYALPNGLRVLLVPDESKPTVTVNITYLVGSRHEGYGESGMAHLLEHLVFKGTPKYPNLPKALDDHGARPNGTTWFDRTNYFETMPATEQNLEFALDMEADRMINSFISKKDLESEFSVVRNEFEAGENSPIGVLVKRILGAAYQWHGYGRSTIGEKSDIESVPIERLQAFYRKYYQPDNAILAVAGKFDPDRTLRLIEQKFGSIPKPERSLDKGNLLYATYTREPVQDGERSVTVRRVGDTPVLMTGYHVPPGSHDDFAAVDVLGRVLRDSPSGRLYKALVEPQLAASVGGFTFQLREPGYMMNIVQLRPTHDVAAARTALETTLDGLRTSTITDEEVTRAKQTILKNLEQELNNAERVGYALTEWASMGDWRLMFLHRDRVEQVSAADVQRVAQRYLVPSNRTLAMFIPEKEPLRAEIPDVPQVERMLAGYAGRAVVQAGESFEATPANIDARALKTQLPSGASLILLPKSTRAARVIGQITLRHGTEQSLFGKGQTAIMTRMMLARGTKDLTREQVRDSLDKLKATVNIFGATNSTIVNVEVTRPNLLPALDLIAQQLRNPRFDADEFTRLRTERLAGIEQSKSEPTVRASIALNRRLNPFPKGHVLYAATPEEQVEDVNAVTLDDVKRFHGEFYGSSFSDVTIVGDFDADSVGAAVQRLLGDWKNPQPFERVVRTYAPTDSSMERIETPDKANAVFFAAQTIELRDDDPDYPAMLLANWMLGGGFNSRLFGRIRQREGISYGVGSGFSAQSLDRYATFTAQAIYAPQNADKLLAAFREEIDKMRNEGFSAEEVTAARAAYVQQREQSRANDEELVGILTSRRYVGRTLTYDADLEKKIEALTAAEVNAAVKKHIDPSKLILVRAGDFAKHPPAQPVP